MQIFIKTLDDKYCKFCNETKSVNFFPKNNRNKDKLDTRCKSCLKTKYQKNKTRNLASQRKWREKNKDYQKDWRKDNSKLKKYQLNYYYNNKEKYKINKQEWRKNNPYKAYQEGVKYREKNREKVNNYSRKWKRNKRIYSPEYKIKENLSRRIRREINKEISTESYLGYKISDLKVYIESRFDIGMNWVNYGICWEIDHIIPCSSWDLNNKIDNYFCWNYRNLTPLWKFKNRSKKNKYSEDDKENYIFLIKAIKFGL